MLSPRLLIAQFLILGILVQVHPTVNATVTNTDISCAASCGNISISYPFRLETDPSRCGAQIYQISCEDNVATMNFSAGLSSTKYFVKDINYDRFTIRLADADVQKDNYCSLPSHSIAGDSFASLYYSYYSRTQTTFYPRYLYQDIVLVTCPEPVISPNYIDALSPCNNVSVLYNYSYAVVGITDPWDLEDSCRIDQIYITSWLPKDANNISYQDVHLSLVYGFEVSWFHGCCLDVRENQCNLDVKTYNDNCRPETQYKSLRSLLLKLENTALFQVLNIFNWDPHPYTIWELQGYIEALLRYVFVLFVLYRAPLYMCGIVFGIIFLIKRWRKRHSSEYGTVEEFLQSHNNMMPVRYSYSDLKKITNNFKEKLGEGGYGSVYKGRLRSGYFAAVKMLGKSNTNGQDFINEVATIGRIHHVNVVRLIGFCVDGSRRALLYEFMPNGSLDKYIFSQENENIISIEKMYEISLGVARGIEYLHRGCNMQILHFDIKPHNILLDENFFPKVSDFGLAKLYPADHSIVSLTAARGTMGYMAPELVYKSIGSISYKADVYSFGKLVMEMAIRRKNVNSSEDHLSQIYFPLWVFHQFNEGRLDVELRGATEEERITTKKMIIVSLWCVQMKPNDRPSMHKVVEMLEGKIESIEIPPKPYFSPPELPKQGFEINGSQELTNIPQSYLDSVSWIASGR